MNGLLLPSGCVFFSELLLSYFLAAFSPLFFLLPFFFWLTAMFSMIVQFMSVFSRL